MTSREERIVNRWRREVDAMDPVRKEYMSDEVRFATGPNGSWSWDRVGPDGKVIATSSRMWRDRNDCIDNALRVNGHPVRYVAP